MNRNITLKTAKTTFKATQKSATVVIKKHRADKWAERQAFGGFR